MSTVDPSRHVQPDLGEAEEELLLDLAEVAIRACLEGTRFPGPDTHRLPEPLLRPCGAFVSLHVDDDLNGCIGNLDADDPIGACVPRLAIQAAFEDPRLPRLRRADLAHLVIEISLLSPRTAVPASTRSELFAHLIPFEHGLVLAARDRRGVFLPSVWEQLPDPDDFVDHLLHKAGLPRDEWPSTMSAELFTTRTIERRLG
jgi:AmmeMemoRadiSam system protein A